jgi:hypothetical protein
MALDSGNKVSNPLVSTCDQKIASVHVTAAGILVWSGSLPDGTAQIVRDDRHHQRTVLDAGLTVDPRSLAVKDSRAFWLRGDVPMTARAESTRTTEGVIVVAPSAATRLSSSRASIAAVVKDGRAGRSLTRA